MPEIIWTPSQTRMQQSALAQFAQQQGFDPLDYEALHRWSIGNIDAFWSAVWDFAGVIGDKGTQAFHPDPAHWMTGAQFFPTAKVNLAENLMRLSGDAIAVIERDETGARRTVTADQLAREVARVADGLRGAGVGPGDRVGTVLPNRVEALVTLLATAAVGGVWTSCSPDFGSAAILDRIGQVDPKVLFVTGQVRYGGKEISQSAKMGEIADQMPTLTALVEIGTAGIDAQTAVTAYEGFGAPSDLTFERVPFDAPAFILYTSGTTGKPKAIVHRTGGALMQLIKEHTLHSDICEGDRPCWYSNTAWMMYHWLIGSMTRGASVVLYDGAPVLNTADGLDASPLWRVVEEEKLTHLGVSPKYMAVLSANGFVPKDQFDTASLRWMFAAGSPMAPAQYDWIYEAVGDLGFASISGGTEILGCFLTGAPTQPLRRGTLTVKALGMGVQVLDARGAPVLDREGELVCTEPFPSMPLTFWGENGDQRYHETYFSDRSQIWTHGDHATIYSDGSATIHGRSDFTLNPGGVRIGTADIYNICDRFAEIDDSVVFGRPVDGDEEIVLCLKMAEGQTVTMDLAKAIRTNLRKECSPRHAPEVIYPVTDIPYTINGKRVEGAAKAMATGGEVKNRASLANPESLAQYAALDRLTPY